MMESLLATASISATSPSSTTPAKSPDCPTLIPKIHITASEYSRFPTKWERTTEVFASQDKGYITKVLRAPGPVAMICVWIECIHLNQSKEIQSWENIPRALAYIMWHIAEWFRGSQQCLDIFPRLIIVTGDNSDRDRHANKDSSPQEFPQHVYHGHESSLALPQDENLKLVRNNVTVLSLHDTGNLALLDLKALLNSLLSLRVLRYAEVEGMPSEMPIPELFSLLIRSENLGAGGRRPLNELQVLDFVIDTSVRGRLGPGKGGMDLVKLFLNIASSRYRYQISDYRLQLARLHLPHSQLRLADMTSDSAVWGLFGACVDGEKPGKCNLRHKSDPSGGMLDSWSNIPHVHRDVPPKNHQWGRGRPAAAYTRPQETPGNVTYHPTWRGDIVRREIWKQVRAEGFIDGTIVYWVTFLASVTDLTRLFAGN
ncbi:hypothetical protein C8J56DRAFT_895463 [Mycena floridula]|nr:hypothetical protein C8J56DRAFT_895463 [Mycena floridula]